MTKIYDPFDKSGVELGKKRYGNSSDFDESKIKRDSDGKFSTTGGGGGGGGGDDNKKDGGSNVVSLAEKKKEKTAIGKTESGKHFYETMTKADMKDFTPDDFWEIGRHYSRKQSELSEEYHKQKNPDGTVSKKHIATRKKIKKELEKIVQKKEKFYALAEGKQGSPDQKDFDRMDRENDPDKRSKGWRKKK